MQRQCQLYWSDSINADLRSYRNLSDCMCKCGSVAAANARFPEMLTLVGPEPCAQIGRRLRIENSRGGSARCVSSSIPQRIDGDSKRRRHLSSARVVEVIAREAWAPFD